MRRLPLAPGSLPWLVLWDLRVRMRDRGFGSARRRTLLFYGGFILLLHGFAGFLLWSMFDNPKGISPRLVEELSRLLLLMLLFFMLMAAGLSSFRLIFSGRELTPQLASPLPFGRILRMRVLGLAITTWSVSILLVTPVANMGALLGHPIFLMAYPVTMVMAVVTVAFMLFLVSAAVRLFGVPRARRILQTMQAVIPLGFVLVSVVGSSGSERPRVNGIGGRGLDAFSGLMTVPARAAAGDALALAGLLALAALAMTLSVRFARHAVLASLQVPDALPPRRSAAAGALRFKAGLFRLLLLKEWRTILRDPRIAGALLIQPLIIVFAFYGGLLHGRFELAGSVAVATYVAAQMSQYVANLMISAEEAPALLGAAPLPRRRVIAYKCAAALTPILALLGAAALWLASRDLWSGLVCLVCCASAAFCACAVEIARPYPSPRRSFVQLNAARRKRDPLDVLSVAMMQIGWTGGAWLLADHSLWGALIVFVVVLVPFFEWWRDANRQALLGY